MFLQDNPIDTPTDGLRNEPLLLPVPEAARLLGIGTTFCWEMVRSGRLPSVRLGRRVLIPRVALEHVAIAGTLLVPAHPSELRQE